MSLILGGAVAAPTVAGVMGGCQGSTSEAWTPSALSGPQNELVVQISEQIIPATDTPGAEAAQVNRFIDRMLAEWYSASDRDRFLAGLGEVDARSQERFGAPYLECSAEEQTRLLEALDEAAYAPPPGESGEEGGEIQSDDEGTPEPEVTQQAGKAVAQAQEQPLSTDSARAPQATPAARPADTAATYGAAPPSEAEEPPFFRTMKELTLMGYFTSEIGMTQELHWEAAPGLYRGCLPVNEARQMRQA